MHFLNILLFVAKYIPFWAVPLGLISLHFGYLFWLKDYRGIAYIWGSIVAFCLVSIFLYFVLGGPDRMARILTQLFN